MTTSQQDWETILQKFFETDSKSLTQHLQALNDIVEPGENNKIAILAESCKLAGTLCDSVNNLSKKLPYFKNYQDEVQVLITSFQQTVFQGGLSIFGIIGRTQDFYKNLVDLVPTPIKSAVENIINVLNKVGDFLKKHIGEEALQDMAMAAATGE